MSIVFSDTAPNFAGLLFQKGNAKTPFSTIIGGNVKTTKSTKFPVGVFYDVEAGAQPAISEAASTTAPQGEMTTRSQQYNTTQIFQKTVEISYHKMADMGTMSGLNTANDSPNPEDELAFQIARRMDKIAADIEFSFIRGQYQEATSNSVAAKTRGLLQAITTNVIPVGTAASPQTLTYWKVAEAMKSINEQGGDTSRLILGVSPSALLQLNADAASNNYTNGAPLTIMGLNLQTVVTPLGTVAVQVLNSLASRGEETSNTAVIFNPEYMGPVYQYSANHPPFMLEPLAKVGAADRFMLYGEVGLDYGPEHFAAKLTNISNDIPTSL